MIVRFLRWLLLRTLSTRELASALAERDDFSGLVLCRSRADLFGSDWVWKAAQLGSRLEALELLDWLASQFPDDEDRDKSGGEKRKEA